MEEGHVVHIGPMQGHHLAGKHKTVRVSIHTWKTTLSRHRIESHIGRCCSAKLAKALKERGGYIRKYMLTCSRSSPSNCINASLDV